MQFTIKNKIFIGLGISISIVVILSIFEFLNFSRIIHEIQQLEVSDGIKSKSLQIRRHEKNFFLFGYRESNKEMKILYNYLDEMDDIVNNNLPYDSSGYLHNLKNLIAHYRQKFNELLILISQIKKELDKNKIFKTKELILINSALLENPSAVIDFLKQSSTEDNKELIVLLKKLDNNIQELRKTGEEIVNISKKIDQISRDNIEKVMKRSYGMFFLFLTLFFLGGNGIFWIVGKNIIKRLNLVTSVVEKVGEGKFIQISNGSKKDEIDLLIRKINEMENKLMQRKIELEEKNKQLFQSKKLAAIGTLATGVAHELNNPLNNIYISVQILQKELKEPSAFVNEILNDVSHEIARVKRIIEDLLEFARGKEPVFKKVRIKDIILKASNSIIKQRNFKNIDLKEIPEEIVITADPDQLERVFFNLFDNAIDAMHEDGQIKLKILEKNDFVEISVSDTGIGIPADKLEKIFEPFFTTKNRGTGLGLAIVYNIIQKHNGKIFVESIEGKGTTFRILLPGTSYEL
ncbi:sensor histidine kinase [Thermodesulfovibrio sp.]|uniref:sensor histidine kinase n=1 Tax=Thermodesulfovibrio sp. TaxID=2067987 RepID=UPI003C7B54A2